MKKLDVLLDKLSLNNDDLLIAYCRETPTIEEAKDLTDSLKANGLPDVVVIFCPPDYKLEAFSEHMMATFGWQRIPGWSPDRGLPN